MFNAWFLYMLLKYGWEDPKAFYDAPVIYPFKLIDNVDFQTDMSTLVSYFFEDVLHIPGQLGNKVFDKDMIEKCFEKAKGEV